MPCEIRERDIAVNRSLLPKQKTKRTDKIICAVFVRILNVDLIINNGEYWWRCRYVTCASIIGLHNEKCVSVHCEQCTSYTVWPDSFGRRFHVAGENWISRCWMARNTCKNWLTNSIRVACVRFGVCMCVCRCVLCNSQCLQFRIRTDVVRRRYSAIAVDDGTTKI